MSDPLKLRQVLEAEQEILEERRRVHFGEEFASQLDDNRFGIALSGGGIRSAVINLGVLKTLQRFNILKQADYLSSVSGGGYTNSYVQATLQNGAGYAELFQDEHIDYLRRRGRYLFPGEGLLKLWNIVTLTVAFLVSFVMSLLSPLVVLLIGYVIHLIIWEVFAFNADKISIFIGDLLRYGAMVMAVIIGVHYLFNAVFVYRLHISSWYNRLEAAVISLILVGMSGSLLWAFKGVKTLDPATLLPMLATIFFLVLLGLLTNPNATSFHRFYRKQLADAFLHFAGKDQNVLLHKMQHTATERELAPYPLINTTLNLQSSSDPNFQGSKASDYFLLSPNYCGAKLVDYVPTATAKGYRDLTLPSAITISAAAVNPGMGAYSNRLLSILTTILNLRLGFWIWNPRKLTNKFPLVWWPSYFFYELFSRISTDKLMVNISDGGHIENLGVMELLRRRCRLILAVDAEADPNYTFGALENLTVRARNELGIGIRFRPGQSPEEVIRPRPSHGYSRQRYAVADLYQLWDKVKTDRGEEIIHYQDNRIGTLIYLKSSVTAPLGRPEIDPDDVLKYGTYKYKIYHPDFPHESTADQFFDPIQWESYFQLGQWLAADLLGCGDPAEYDPKQPYMIGLEELQDHFDRGRPLHFPHDPVQDFEAGMERSIRQTPHDETSVPPPVATEVSGRPMGYNM